MTKLVDRSNMEITKEQIMSPKESAAFWETLCSRGIALWTAPEGVCFIQKSRTYVDNNLGFTKEKNPLLETGWEIEEQLMDFPTKAEALEYIKNIIKWEWKEEPEVVQKPIEPKKLKFSMFVEFHDGYSINTADLGEAEVASFEEIEAKTLEKAKIYFKVNKILPNKSFEEIIKKIKYRPVT